MPSMGIQLKAEPDSYTTRPAYRGFTADVRRQNDAVLWQMRPTWTGKAWMFGLGKWGMVHGVLGGLLRLLGESQVGQELSDNLRYL